MPRYKVTFFNHNSFMVGAAIFDDTASATDVERLENVARTLYKLTQVWKYGKVIEVDSVTPRGFYTSCPKRKR